MNGNGNEAEAMRDLASLLWNRFLRGRVLEELTHEMNAFRAEVVTNNGDGTLTVKRPFEDNTLTLRAAASLSRAAGGDQVLILGIGDKRKALSNAFILCKTDLSSFVSQEEMLAAFPTDTASGDPASFPDGADGVPVKSLVASIAPMQSGSGDPSPSNVRPISGWTGLTLSHSGADTSDPETLSVSWQSEAGTVYGGTLNVTTGVLTVTRVVYALTGDEPFSLASNSRRFQANLSDLGWAEPAKQPSGNTSFNPDAICSHCRQWTGSSSDTSFSYRFQHYTSGLVRFNFYDTGEAFASASAFLAYLTAQAVGGTPVQVSYTLAAPITHQLAPTQVRTLLGENNLWADTGDVTVEYRADPTLYIEKKLGA